MDRTFLITSVTAQRRVLFQCVATANLFVDVFLRYREQGKYLLHEFVVMPNHFHALITPAPEISLERAVQFIKGGFSFRLKSSLPVWQARFTNHRIRDGVDFGSIARTSGRIRCAPVWHREWRTIRIRRRRENLRSIRECCTCEQRDVAAFLDAPVDRSRTELRPVQEYVRDAMRLGLRLRKNSG